MPLLHLSQNLWLFLQTVLFILGGLKASVRVAVATVITTLVCLSRHFTARPIVYWALPRF